MSSERCRPGFWLMLMTLCLALIGTACSEDSGGASVGTACTAHAECASGLVCDCSGTCEPEDQADTTCYRDGGPQDDACVTNCMFDDVFGAC